MMPQEKFNTVKAASLEMSREEWRWKYPQLNEEQITILIEGEADEPSRKSVQSSTTTNKREGRPKWGRFRQLDT